MYLKLYFLKHKNSDKISSKKNELLKNDLKLKKNSRKKRFFALSFFFYGVLRIKLIF